MATFRTRWLGLRTLGATALLVTAAGISWSSGSAQAPANDAASIDTPAFEKQVKPFFQQNCVRCHNEDTAMAGVRVDGLDAGFEDRHVRLWEAIRHRVDEGTMPPKGMPQPSPADRQQLVAHLEMTSQWLDDEVKGLSPAQWTYKVSPDSWSVANVLDHLSVRWRVESHGPAGDVVRHRSHPPGAYD